jgi:hypothetical protein
MCAWQGSGSREIRMLKGRYEIFNLMIWGAKGFSIN